MGSLRFPMLVLVIHGNWASSRPSLGVPSCPARCTCLPDNHYVKCSNSSLTSPPPGIPKDTVKLHLQHNNFPELSASFWQGVPELNILYLSHCNISTMRAGVFQEGNHIRTLHLDWNQLSDLEIGTFNNLSSLLFLHLESNRIGYLHPGVFSPLKRLLSLYLSHNLLTELSDGALRGLTQVRWLDLGYNMISNIASTALFNMDHLSKLNLERNNLTEVPYAVKTLSVLQMLRLSGNQIKGVHSSNFFWRMPSLTMLYLDNMGLEILSRQLFNTLTNLEILDLRNNSLTYLPGYGIKASTQLYLTGNPWKCDCAIINLHTLLQKRQDAEEPVLCQSPKALEGQSLRDVDLQKLTCPPYDKDIIITKTPQTAGQTKPTLHPPAATSKSTSTTYQTSPSGSTSSPVPGGHEKTWDPCLADHISNVVVSSIEDKTLDITWTDAGDYNQFELRYNTGTNMSKLHIYGGSMHVRLYGLQPGTTYTVCIVPQNVDIRQCQAPKAQQCASGQTAGVHEEPYYVYYSDRSTSPYLSIGVSIVVVVLVAITIFIVYILRCNSTHFQRYYNEDGEEGSRRPASDPYKLDCVYENIDDDRHVYVTASSLWGMENDKLDCSLAEPLPPVPKYVTL